MLSYDKASTKILSLSLFLSKLKSLILNFIQIILVQDSSLHLFKWHFVVAND